VVRGAWPGGDARAESALQPARHYLDGVLAALKDSGVAVGAHAQPAGDDIAAGIVGEAEALGAGLIMLATHGHTGVRRLVMGSVADGVIRTAPCPVLAMRGGASGTIG